MCSKQFIQWQIKKDELSCLTRLTNASGKIVESDLWCAHLAPRSQGQDLRRGLKLEQRWYESSSYYYKSSLTNLDEDEPDWIIEQAKARKRRDMLRQREEMQARLAKVRAREKAQQDKYLRGDQTLKRRKMDVNADDEDNEDQYLLDDYESDRETGIAKSGSSSVFSEATLKLMQQVGMVNDAKDEDEEIEDEIKVSQSRELMRIV